MARHNEVQSAEKVIRLLDELEQHRCDALTVATLLACCDGAGADACTVELAAKAGGLMERHLSEMRNLLREIAKLTASSDD